MLKQVVPKHIIEERRKRNSFLSDTLWNKRGRFNGTGTLSNERSTALRMAILFTVLLVFPCDVLGNDLSALQNVLTRLCSLNSIGHFASCCEMYSPSNVTFEKTPIRDCFIGDLYATKQSILTSLFVVCLHAFVLYASFSFFSLVKKEIWRVEA